MLIAQHSAVAICLTLLHHVAFVCSAFHHHHHQISSREEWRRGYSTIHIHSTNWHMRCTFHYLTCEIYMVQSDTRDTHSTTWYIHIGKLFVYKHKKIYWHFLTFCEQYWKIRNLFSQSFTKVVFSSLDSGTRWLHNEDDEDSLLCDATSNLTTIPHMLSSRYF